MREKSTVNIHDCLVYENNGYPYDDYYIWGGGFQFHNSDVKIHNVIFHDNNAFSGYGGGMSIDSCNLELSNAIFTTTMLQMQEDLVFNAVHILV